MNDRLIAFDDNELGSWLIDLIADGSDIFLCALAEAVVTANPADYDVIRPALSELKNKYCNADHTQVPGRRLSPGRRMLIESQRVRSQIQ